ncbi:hypothetical protein RKD44_001462 [Streptomyces collinus]
MQIALDLLAWMPMLALTGEAILWEPRRLRLGLLSTAGQLVTTASSRQRQIDGGSHGLQACEAPGLNGACGWSIRALLHVCVDELRSVPGAKYRVFVCGRILGGAPDQWFPEKFGGLVVLLDGDR